MNLRSRKKLIAVLTNPQVQVRALTVATCLLAAAPVFAQAGGDPWTRAVQVLQQSFTTTIARGLALVAIVVGGLGKQGNPVLRFLWCQAAVHAVREDADLYGFYRRKLVQKGAGKARVAAARKLGIRLYIMLRDQIDYEEFCRRGQMRQNSGAARAGMPEVGRGPAVQ